MPDRPRDWHPSPKELERILAEMRPIIADFARRARADEYELRLANERDAMTV